DGGVDLSHRCVVGTSLDVMRVADCLFLTLERTQLAIHESGEAGPIQRDRRPDNRRIRVRVYPSLQSRSGPALHIPDREPEQRSSAYDACAEPTWISTRYTEHENRR